MIVLFTDYGLQGPYIGQVEAVLQQQAPGIPVVNLFADLPRQNPKVASYLLEAYCNEFPEGTVFFCVVDPGVGSFEHKPVAVNIDHRWYVGPDNGLFDITARRGAVKECFEITWRPERLSNSFHGRDLYAPVCAILANGYKPDAKQINWRDQHQWPDDLYEIIYIDGFGNAITGVRASELNSNAIIQINDTQIRNASTFADVPPGQLFWYENANDLVEIAVNQGSTQELFKLQIGTTFSIA